MTMEWRGFLGWSIYDAIFNKLYHHYHRDADVEEHYTDKQLVEQNVFMDRLFASPIINKTYTFLACKGKLSVRFTVVVVHWQKLRDCFFKAIVPVAHNVLPVITVISHLTQSTRYCCGRGHSP